MQIFSVRNNSYFLSVVTLLFSNNKSLPNVSATYYLAIFKVELIKTRSLMTEKIDKCFFMLFRQWCKCKRIARPVFFQRDG